LTAAFFVTRLVLRFAGAFFLAGALRLVLRFGATRLVRRFLTAAFFVTRLDLRLVGAALRFGTTRLVFRFFSHASLRLAAGFAMMRRVLVRRIAIGHITASTPPSDA
jgi:hypothetical protein